MYFRFFNPAFVFHLWVLVPSNYQKYNMKNELKQQARNLFLDTNLSKTEIANRLGVDRGTIRLWSQDGNWENLRRSSRHLPSMVAEKCYYLIDHYTTGLLSASNPVTTFTAKDADAINKMASAIKKLKARSTVNESMEMFNFFIEDVYRKNPQMAKDISPYIDDYITNRKDVYNSDFRLSEFDVNGQIPWKVTDEELREKWEDEKEEEMLQQQAVLNDAPMPAPEPEPHEDSLHYFRPLAAPGKQEPVHPSVPSVPTRPSNNTDSQFHPTNNAEKLPDSSLKEILHQPAPDQNTPLHKNTGRGENGGFSVDSEGLVLV